MIVYTGGTFDGLHAGHLALLGYCRDLSGADGKVFVGLNRDEFVERYKGHPPQHSYATRQRELMTTRRVDHVVANVGDEDSRLAIEGVAPAVVVIGSDWHAKDYLDQMGFDFDWLDRRRIVLAYAPRPSGGPSTSGTWA